MSQVLVLLGAAMERIRELEERNEQLEEENAELRARLEKNSSEE